MHLHGAVNRLDLQRPDRLIKGLGDKVDTALKRLQQVMLRSLRKQRMVAATRMLESSARCQRLPVATRLRDPDGSVIPEWGIDCRSESLVRCRTDGSRPKSSTRRGQLRTTATRRREKMIHRHSSVHHTGHRSSRRTLLPAAHWGPTRASRTRHSSRRYLSLDPTRAQLNCASMRARC